MAKRNGKYSLERWRQDAPHVDKKAWGAAYDQFFREALQRAPQWRKWANSGEITLNERQSVIWEKIRRREGTFLDVGCGPGFLLGALLAHGRDAWGVDVSQEAVNFARKGLSSIGKGDRCFRLNAEDLPTLGKTYDTVTCMDMLEHVVDPEATLRILWDAVAENGVLYVTVPKRVNDFNLEHLHEFNDERVRAMVDMVCDGGEKKYPAVASQIQTQEGTVNWVISVEKQEADLKFVMVSGSTSETQQANDISGDGRIKTGLFNWQRLFRGFAAQSHVLENPQDYDVIHIQVSGTNFDAPRQIRKKLGYNSDTKLVVNLDYAPEFWYMYPPYPDLLLDQLNHADYVMSVEPHAAQLLAELLGRPVYTIPHPAEIDSIMAQAKPIHERSEALVMLHRDMQDYLPYWMLKESFLRTRVIGRLSPVANATGSAIDYPAMMYDYIHEGYLGGEQAIEVMSRVLLAVDCYTHHVCGRSQIEMAALGVPCIGYANVWAQRECFPALTIEPGDVLAARALVRRLLEDQEFYQKVSREAQEKARMFDYDHARERYLTMLGRMEGDTRPALPQGIEEVRSAPIGPLEPAEGAVADTEGAVLVE